MALKDGIVKAGVGLGLVSFILSLMVTALPYWRVSDAVASDPFMSQINSVEGLWIRCTATYKEYYSCDWYDTALIGLPAYITGFRALMVVSMIATFAGFIMSIFGLSCLSALDDEDRNKRYVVMGAGSIHIVAGCVTCLCVSWYASEVVREYFDPLFSESAAIKFTFGACLYLGWISTIVSLAAGCMMLCCHLRSGDDDKGMYNPTTTQAVPMMSRQPYQVNSAPIYKKTTARRSQEYQPRDYDYDRSQNRSNEHRTSARVDKTSANHEGYV